MTIDEIFGISEGYIGIVRNKAVKVQAVYNKGHKNDEETHFQIEGLLHEAIPLYDIGQLLF